MSKSDWANVPKETMYIATDADGYAHGWSGEQPKYYDDELSWLGGKSKVTMFMLEPQDNPIKGDWRNSLEQRPQELK